MSRDVQAGRDTALRLGPRSVAVLAVASLAGLAMFLWPLILQPAPGDTRVDQPFIFMLLLPVVVLVVVAELTEGGMDSKVLAVLAVLTAVNGAIRLLGAGTAGIETIFFLLIIAGRVYGAGFGFVLGCTSLFASALLSSGVGPWLPFQMMCAAWIGMGAGLLPSRLRGRAEIAVLVLYGVVAAYLYGFLMNLSSWPFTLGIASPGAGDTAQMVPGDPVLENLHRFVVYTLLTSTWGWDTGRAITTALCLVVLGPALLTTLRRALRRVQHVATTTPSLTS
ncbi:MAG: ECF transporter S component [Aeromicrobium sp.]|uniref:ECF transporter S component n=1 Tax=Aeromicrobium sp. TaxID=1871063 RepID=UPI0025C47906|nr:ECF transporter S component [Aeromicrobium sp.]MCK5890438.1 ECF transporter S component [Aeromicrobium sp.]MDF1705647.1 ECF transporter S component [Aeromicrobium sp.]